MCLCPDELLLAMLFHTPGISSLLPLLAHPFNVRFANVQNLCWLILGNTILLVTWHLPRLVRTDFEYLQCQRSDSQYRSEKHTDNNRTCARQRCIVWTFLDRCIWIVDWLIFLFISQGVRNSDSSSLLSDLYIRNGDTKARTVLINIPSIKIKVLDSKVRVISLVVEKGILIPG